jgi:hypothetical protein
MTNEFGAIGMVQHAAQDRERTARTSAIGNRQSAIGNSHTDLAPEQLIGADNAHARSDPFVFSTGRLESVLYAATPYTYPRGTRTGCARSSA